MAEDIYIYLGKDTEGENVKINLTTAPHVLIAGTTGSGKSSLIHMMILSAMNRMAPKNLELYLGDPKLVEFADYAYMKLPHVRMLVNSAEEHLEMLKYLCDVMDARYVWMRERGLKNAKNSSLSNILVVIDEFGDLVLHPRCGKGITMYLTRLIQLGRAAGVTVVIASQHPVVQTVSTTIKANIPTRLLFKCSSSSNSRVVVDSSRGTNLRGNGHMLLMDPYRQGLLEVQAPFLNQEKLELQFQSIKNRYGSKTDSSKRRTA